MIELCDGNRGIDRPTGLHNENGHTYVSKNAAFPAIAKKSSVNTLIGDLHWHRDPKKPGRLVALIFVISCGVTRTSIRPQTKQKLQKAKIIFIQKQRSLRHEKAYGGSNYDTVFNILESFHCAFIFCVTSASDISSY